MEFSPSVSTVRGTLSLIFLLMLLISSNILSVECIKIVELPSLILRYKKFSKPMLCGLTKWSIIINIFFIDSFMFNNISIIYK